MIAKIGNRLVEGLKPKDKPYQVHDAELRRFFVRVQPTGRLLYGCNVVLPDGRRSTRTIGPGDIFTPAQARDEARRILADITRGIDPDVAKRAAREHTLETFLASEYGPWVKAKQKRGDATVRMIEKSFEELLPKRLSEINAWLVEKWRAQALAKGIKATSVNRYLDALRAALNQAVAWDFISSHPMRKVKRCKVDSRGKVRFLSEDEEDRLRTALDQREDRLRAERANANHWRAVRGYELYPDLSAAAFADYLKPMVLLSLNLGLRRGELLQLEREHVDLERAMVTVVGDNAKNGQTRHVPLNAEALSAMRAWIAQRNIVTGFLFCGAEGKRLTDVKKAWNGVLASAGIQDFRWHDLRHHFASRLVMAGVDLNTVRELMGHADIQMTLRYAHLAPHVKAEAVSKLDRILDRRLIAHIS